MNRGEYEVMSRVEDTHWWYRGLRGAIRAVLGREGVVGRGGLRVLDAGCGTGANLAMLGELLSPEYLGGFDRSTEALDLARVRAPAADLYPSDICAPETRAESLDLIVSLDVICIPGRHRSLAGLQELSSALRTGGLFVVNLPAYEWLRSEHDLAVHIHERYTAPQLRQLLADMGLDVVLVTYRLCFLFPLLVVARLPRMARTRAANTDARSDLHKVPAAWLNRALEKVMGVENALILRGFRLPWGSSVFAVGRKP